MAKRRKILYVKGEETANPRYAHWVLGPQMKDSQVLIPPSPEVVETEEEEEGQGQEENPARPATDSAEDGKQEKKEEQPENLIRYEPAVDFHGQLL